MAKEIKIIKCPQCGGTQKDRNQNRHTNPNNLITYYRSMAFTNFFKKQLSTVIEWVNQPPHILVCQYPSSTNEIKNASKLIIAPGQGCIVIYEGKVADILLERRHL